MEPSVLLKEFERELAAFDWEETERLFSEECDSLFAEMMLEAEMVGMPDDLFGLDRFAVNTGKDYVDLDRILRPS